MSLFSWLRKPVRMPDEMKETLEAEGLLYLKEGAKLTATFRNFKAPGKHFSFRKSTGFGSLGISEKRVVGYSAFTRIIHVPFDNPKFSSLEIEAVDNKFLLIAFEASEFSPKQSGRVEIRFYIKDVAQVYGILSGKGS